MEDKKEIISERFLNDILELSNMSKIECSEDMQDALEDINILTTAYKNREKIAEVNYKYVPYQLCPKCNGAGRISSNLYSSASFCQCDVCKGKMVIPMQAYE